MLKLLQKLKTELEAKALLEIAESLRVQNNHLTKHNTELMSENVELKEKTAKLEEENKMLRILVGEQSTPPPYIYDTVKKEGE